MKNPTKRPTTDEIEQTIEYTIEGRIMNTKQNSSNLNKMQRVSTGKDRGTQSLCWNTKR